MEGYWTLANGDEWGWQAKFFLDGLGQTQWRQITASVTAAVENHQRLTRYTICLPLDRSDPKTTKQPHRKTQLAQWRAHEQKWLAIAKSQGVSLEISYWGTHEIFDRLSRSDHAGRLFFWFHEDLFTSEWFQHRFEEVRADVGERYTPELNIDLPVARLFDGLGRTPPFFSHFAKLLSRLRRDYRPLASGSSPARLTPYLKTISDAIEPLLSFLSQPGGDPTRVIDLQAVSEHAKRARDRCWTLINVAKELEAQLQKQGTHDDQIRERLNARRYFAGQVAGDLSSILEYLGSSECLLANTPALLLRGAAGTGKTHLFCDVAERRIKDGLPTVLFLGQHFVKGEPWPQMLERLGLSCSRDEFLGALEAAAEARGTRAMLIIDALNEGEGRLIWKERLPGFLTSLTRSPYMSVSLSVRTSYESAVVPDSLTPDKLLRDIHHGFAANEYEATKIFFKAFGIRLPAVPLLNPEFSNPLFLKLFCKGLKNRGLTEIPRDHHGSTKIFEFLIDSVNERLSAESILDFDPRIPYTSRALDNLAQVMAESNRVWLPSESAASITEAVLTARGGYERSLLRHLVSEGILAEDRFWQPDDRWVDGVRFTYERLSDHMIATHLLRKYLDLADPVHSFQSEPKLATLVQDEMTCERNAGLLEALAIQLPDYTGHELPEVAPLIASFSVTRRAVIASLVWRARGSFSGKTADYINHYLVSDWESRQGFLEALLTLAAVPGHPYNATYLNRYLRSYDMPERDTFWSTFLHEQWGQQSALDRLIDWAWEVDVPDRSDDDAVFLAASAVAWFLTTPNRYVRDRATKALVRLLTPRLPALLQLLVDFEDVDDVYVSERLFAAAYGCLMRAEDVAASRAIGLWMYRAVFGVSQPRPHVLLRDYARGAIELACRRGRLRRVDMRRVRPPYGSKWPRIPSDSKLRPMGEWTERRGTPGDKARLWLFDSVMGQGDFARYIIGTNSGHFPWSKRRLGESHPATVEEQYRAFVGTLSTRQRDALQTFELAHTMLSIRLAAGGGVRLGFGRPTTKAAREQQRRAKRALKATLGSRRAAVFEGLAKRYLSRPRGDDLGFDLRVAQRWVLGRVLDLGWTQERFGHFDASVNRFDTRDPNKSERIGKKYQWIAWHEFLARVADNFEYRGYSPDGEPTRYEGPWQLSTGRDIDPSCMLRQTQRDKWHLTASPWWSPTVYEHWNEASGDIAWLKRADDLPAPTDLIDLIRPHDGSRWLSLETFVRWQSLGASDDETARPPRREIWYMLRAYVIRQKDLERFVAWARQQDFTGRWMPESTEVRDAFLGEFYWAPSLNPTRRLPWIRSERLPVRVLVPSVEYVASLEYDCSRDDSYSILLPAAWLANSLAINWRGQEGEFFSPSGQLVAFDPSVREAGPGALLVEREALLSQLAKRNWSIVWTVLGEKRAFLGFAPEHYLGRLDISGVFGMKGMNLEGSVTPRFKEPASGKP